MKPFLFFVLIYLGACISNAEDLNPVTAGVRDNIVKTFAKAKSQRDILNPLSARLSKQEFLQFKKILLTTKEIPRVGKIENGFEMKLGAQKIEVNMIDAHKNKYKINGVNFFLHEKLDFYTQLEILMNELQKNRGSYSWIHLMIPNAHAAGLPLKPLAAWAMSGLRIAGPAVVTGVTVAVAQGVTAPSEDAAKASVCLSQLKNDPEAYLQPGLGFCKIYADNKNEALKKSPENEALKKTLQLEEKNKDKTVMFRTEKDLCPHETKDHSYFGKVQVIRHNDKGIVTGTQIIHINAEFDKANKPQHVKIFNDDFSRTLATYRFEADATLKEIVIPYTELENAKKTAVTPDEIKISAIAQLTDQPVLKAHVDFHKSVFAHLAEKIAMCGGQKKEKEAEFAVNPANQGRTGKVGTNR